MTKAAVSKRVMLLEELLGTQLIKRNTRSISFTTAGNSFYTAAKKITFDYRNAITEITRESSEAEGIIRVGGPLSFGRLSLANTLISFISTNPKIHVQLVLSDRFANVIADGLDLVVRLGEMKDSNLSGRSLGFVRRMVCASPSYIRQYGEPKTPKELINHRIIHYSGLQSGCRWPFIKDGSIEYVDVVESFTADNGEILAQAAAAGDGIVLLPDFILKPYLDNGELVQVLEDHPPLDLNLHLLWPRHAPISHRLRLLIDHLVSHYENANQ